MLTAFKEFCEHFNQDVIDDFGSGARRVIYGCCFNMFESDLINVRKELQALSSDEDFRRALGVTLDHTHGFYLVRGGYERADISVICETIDLYLSQRPQNLWELNAQIDAIGASDG